MRGEAADILDEDAPVAGVGVGGMMLGVAGWFFLSVLGLFGGGVGEANSLGLFGEGVAKPSVSTSTPSFSRTVPSPRNACSKSRSVRDTLLLLCLSLGVAGCRPDGNAEGGAAKRGELVALRNATMTDGLRDKTSRNIRIDKYTKNALRIT